MSEIFKERLIEPMNQDYFAFLLGGLDDLKFSIPEKEITVFCSGCDSLGENNICERVGSNNQARYASRKWCGWAETKGERGQMTIDGFIGPQQPTEESTI